MHLPDAATLDWGAVHDVPLALVTGSNGKTTTVRLMAAMLKAGGLDPWLEQYRRRTHRG